MEILEKINFKEKKPIFNEMQNPFHSSCINAVSIWIRKDEYKGIFTFSAYIKFKNMKTEGEQKIEASSFEELYNKVQACIESLS